MYEYEIKKRSALAPNEKTQLSTDSTVQLTTQYENKAIDPQRRTEYRMNTLQNIHTQPLPSTSTSSSNIKLHTKKDYFNWKLTKSIEYYTIIIPPLISLYKNIVIQSCLYCIHFHFVAQ